MKTELIIKLNSDDCKKIQEDLKGLMENTSNLNPETYLLYNKIKGSNCAYIEIEGKNEGLKNNGI